MVAKHHKDPVGACLTLLRMILIALVAIIVMMASRAYAQGHHGHGHDKLHHWYSQLMRPDVPNSSCCNKEDCRPTTARQLADGTWEAIKDGRWVKIPQSKINREESYDTQAHICAPMPHQESGYPADFVFCFVKPGAGI